MLKMKKALNISPAQSYYSIEYTTTNLNSQEYNAKKKGEGKMTVTLRNVDYQFLNIIESILPLCKRVEVDTAYDEPAVRRASTKPQFSSC